MVTGAFHITVHRSVTLFAGAESRQRPTRPVNAPPVVLTLASELALWAVALLSGAGVRAAARAFDVREAVRGRVGGIRLSKRDGEGHCPYFLGVH